MNFWHYVMANGRDYQPCKAPAKWIKRRGKIGNCYKNAFLLVLEHPLGPSTCRRLFLRLTASPKAA